MPHRTAKALWRQRFLASEWTIIRTRALGERPYQSCLSDASPLERLRNICARFPVFLQIRNGNCIFIGPAGQYVAVLIRNDRWRISWADRADLMIAHRSITGYSGRRAAPQDQDSW